MSVARSSMPVPEREQLDAGQRLDGAARRRGAGDGLELREQRLALRGNPHLVACFKIDSDDSLKRGNRHRGVDGVHNAPENAARCGSGLCGRCAHERGSLSAARGVTAAPPSVSVSRRTTSKASRVVGDALGGPPAGVHDRRVVAAAEVAADRGQRLRGELAREVHGDLAWPGDARRRGWWRGARRRRCRTPRRCAPGSRATVVARASACAGRGRGRRAPRRRARRSRRGR